MASGDVVRIKVLTAGDGGVGKSCIVKYFCEEKFVSRYVATIGVDYGVRAVDVNRRPVRVNFWDLSGHPEFFEVRNEFYKDTQGCLLVFDLSSRKSFDNLDSWLEEMKRFGAGEPVVYLCGNKSDKKRAVKQSEAKAWASSKGFKYFETSCKSGDGVHACFDALFRDVLAKL